jgi:hypothetical protein
MDTLYTNTKILENRQKQKCSNDATQLQKRTNTFFIESVYRLLFHSNRKTKTTLHHATSFLPPNAEPKSRLLKTERDVGRPGGGRPIRPHSLGTGVAQAITNSVPNSGSPAMPHSRPSFATQPSRPRPRSEHVFVAKATK